MKISTYLKIALFCAICGVLFVIAAFFTSVYPIFYLAGVAGIACLISLLACLCKVIFAHFAYSLNVVFIVIFFAIAIFGIIVDPDRKSVLNINGLMYLGYISMIWIASALAGFVSMMVLIGRLLFRKKPDLNQPVQNVSASTSSASFSSVSNAGSASEQNDNHSL